MAHALQSGRNSPLFFKVPADQRRANKEAFDPYMFSFGPYHACAPSLRDGEHFKRLVAPYVLAEDGLKRLVDRIKTDHEAQLRDGYIQMSEPLCHKIDSGHVCAEDVQICVEALAKVLALDSVLFISSSLESDPPLIPNFTRCKVFNDAVLLDNQIPIFVLKCALAEQTVARNPSLAGTLKAFTDFANPFKAFKPMAEPTITDESAPLLRYVYDFLTEAAVHKSDEVAVEGGCVLSPASHLARCGLRFRPRELATFRGIEFSEKSLELRLPKITVYDSTPRFLHNLLAFEAICEIEPFPVTSYVYFMDCLIDTEEDVQILVEAGVITNLLGSHQQLAHSWNRLATNVPEAITKADQETATRVEMLVNKQWRKWRAALKEKYWEKQPWLVISVVAATILLLLTLLQTIYTIKAYAGSVGH